MGKQDDRSGFLESLPHLSLSFQGLALGTHDPTSYLTNICVWGSVAGGVSEEAPRSPITYGPPPPTPTARPEGCQ